MKRTVIIAGLALISIGAFAQVKGSIVKPDTLQLPVMNKDVAKIVLKAMNEAANKMQVAEDISAKDGIEAINVYSFYIQAIFKKWPDLIPKQPGK